MKKFLVSVVGVMLSLLAFSQNFPFPMNESGYKYPYGIVASNPDNSKIQSKFVAWDNTMYKESSDGKYGRIRYDNEAETVSEGIVTECLFMCIWRTKLIPSVKTDSTNSMRITKNGRTEMD